MALGARGRDVTALFLRHALRLSGIGIATGVALASGLTRAMSAFLFGVGPRDPLVFVAASGALAAIAQEARSHAADEVLAFSVTVASESCWLAECALP